MSLTNKLYSLALRAAPRDFRDANQEEILGTLADLHDAHKGKGPVRQAISLSYDSNRLRWLRATGGSIAETSRQGLAWGALLLIGRQAGLGLQEVLRGLWLQPRWLPYDSATVAEIALTLGWLAVFGLLIAGRRRWGLTLLGAVLAGYVAHEVMLTLGYGGPFSWAFTLRFFLPTTLPLLLAYVRPGRPVRASWRLGAAILVLATAVVPVTMLFGPSLIDHFVQFGLRATSYISWGIPFGLCVIAGIFVLLASLSDPRWAVMTTLIAFQPIIHEGISEIAGGRDFPGYVGLLLLVTLVPAGALLLSWWAGRRAASCRVA